jgi:hypothetical protein
LTTNAGDSDLLTVYNAYSAWKRIRNTPGVNEYTFCRKNFLSPQTLLNIEDIKMQLVVSIVDSGLVKLNPSEQASMNRYLSQIVASMDILHLLSTLIPGSDIVVIGLDSLVAIANSSLCLNGSIPTAIAT